MAKKIKQSEEPADEMLDSEGHPTGAARINLTFYGVGDDADLAEVIEGVISDAENRGLWLHFHMSARMDEEDVDEEIHEEHPMLDAIAALRER